MIRTPRLARVLVRWFATAARDLPWRRTRNPYAVWIAEVMLQQTTVAAVVPHYTRWTRELPTLGALATASPERVYRLWEGLGYYRRADNLLRAAWIIAARPDELFPRRFAERLALPGLESDAAPWRQMLRRAIRRGFLKSSIALVFLAGGFFVVEALLRAPRYCWR